MRRPVLVFLQYSLFLASLGFETSVLGARQSMSVSTQGSIVARRVAGSSVSFDRWSAAQTIRVGRQSAQAAGASIATDCRLVFAQRKARRQSGGLRRGEAGRHFKITVPNLLSLPVRLTTLATLKSKPSLLQHF